MVAFLVSASGQDVAGIGSPFWGLLAGLAFLGLRHHRRAPGAAPDAAPDTPQAPAQTPAPAPVPVPPAAPTVPTAHSAP